MAAAAAAAAAPPVNLRLGDLVWGKLGRYPPWPGKIVNPPKDLKKPRGKKCFFVKFFGTEDHAWIKVEQLKPYHAHKEEMIKINKGKRFQQAVDAVEEFLKKGKGKDQDTTIPESSTVKKMMTGTMAGFKWPQSVSEPVKDGDPHFHHFLLSQTEKPAVCYQAITKKLKVCEEETGSTSIQAADSTAINGSITPTDKKIGFLGLGLMGSGIVSNLIKMGHTVTVWNRTAEKCDLFIQEGARLGRTPAEVVSTCDITFACVSDPKAAKDVMAMQKASLDFSAEVKSLNFFTDFLVRAQPFFASADNYFSFETTSFSPGTSTRTHESILIVQEALIHSAKEREEM